MALGVGLGFVTHTSGASAFSGVFFSNDDRSASVVEHRIAVSLSTTETVLWDQPRWQKAPRSFAWVVPIRPGSTWTLTSDAWFASLEASTEPVVYAPPEFGLAGGCAVGSRGAFGLTGVAGCSSDSAYGGGPSTTEVKAAAVADPVESLTISGRDRGALEAWLTARDYPTSFAKTAIAELETAGYDFVVMRVEPACNETATRPIRVITPGATPIPTPLMRASAASNSVAIKLFALAPERRAIAGAANVSVDPSKLVWDRSDHKSNYAELRTEAIASGGGRRWLVEYANAPSRAKSTTTSVTASFLSIYPGLCGTSTLPNSISITPPAATSCTTPSPPRDASADGSDDGGDASSDAGDAGDTTDASVDASDGGEPDASDTRPPSKDSCAVPDDLTAGLRNFDPNEVFLTRMQGEIVSFGSTPDSGELTLIAEPNGAIVPNGLQAVIFDDDRDNRPDRSSACEAVRARRASSRVLPLIIASAMLASLLLRRRGTRD